MFPFRNSTQPLGWKGIVKRILINMALVLAVLATAGSWGLYNWLKTALPPETQEIRSVKIATKITVVRDGRGIPFIRAGSFDDGAFALGYLHAQDRFWQMEAMRRLGAGRLAEVVGRPGLSTDRLMRTLGLYRLAEAQTAVLDQETLKTIQAYADGVNAWLDARTGAPPPEILALGYDPEPWNPADSLVWGRLMGLQLSGNWRDELLRARLSERLSAKRIAELWPGETRGGELGELDHDLLGKLAALFPPPVAASNAWAVAGAHTASGKPILANDPHLPFSMPNLWYLARVDTPGGVLAGATVPGAPFFIVGHNGRIAWGMTTTQSDTCDLFRERAAPDNPGEYVTPTGPLPFEGRVERIRIKDEESEALIVRTTRHGPVLSDVVKGERKGDALALAATYLLPDDRTPDAVLRLNRAGNLDEALDALRHFHSPQQNVMVADASGRIGVLSAGRAPLRGELGDGRYPKAGWDGKGDWTGFVSFEDLPRLIDPLEGMVANANNRLMGPDYPHYLGDDWEAPYRIRRIENMLGAASEPLTVAAVSAQQMDATSLMARDLLPLMLKTLGPAPGDGVAMLKAWDGTMGRDRPEPLLFSAWMAETVRALLADETGFALGEYWGLKPRVVASILTKNTHWCDDVETNGVEETCRDRLNLALGRAMQRLGDEHGPDMKAWRWGAAHRARFHHALFGAIPVVGLLANRDVEADGGAYTVNVGAFRPGDEDAPFAATHGPGLRVVLDLNALDTSRFAIAGGQSGHPLSYHYDDFLEDWRDGRTVALNSPETPASRLTITPKGQ